MFNRITTFDRVNNPLTSKMKSKPEIASMSLVEMLSNHCNTNNRATEALSRLTQQRPRHANRNLLEQSSLLDVCTPGFESFPEIAWSMDDFEGGGETTTSSPHIQMFERERTRVVLKRCTAYRVLLHELGGSGGTKQSSSPSRRSAA
jgi:hypothetical protein